MVIFYTTEEGGKFKDFFTSLSQIIIVGMLIKYRNGLPKPWSLFNTTPGDIDSKLAVHSVVFPDGDIWDASLNGFRKMPEGFGQRYYEELYQTIVEKRRSGRTTRMADRYIQELFKTKICTPIDHFKDGSKETVVRMNEHLIRILTRRLSSEHPGTKFTVKKDKSNQLTSITLD